MASITIDLDGNAEEGLVELEKQLGQTSSQVGELAASSVKLTEVQNQQITITKQQTSDWKSFGIAAANAQAEGAKLATTIGNIVLEGEEFAAKAGLKVIDIMGNLAVTTAKYVLIAKGAIGVVKAFKGETTDAGAAAEKAGAKQESSFISTAAKATVAGAAIATLTGKWNSMGEVAAAASGIAVKSLAGIGPFAAVTVAGIEAINLALANTGKRTDELGRTTTNLDRLTTSQGKLIESARAWIPTVDEVIEGYAALDPRIQYVTKSWGEFDKYMTRTTDGMRDTLAEVNKLINSEAELERQQLRLSTIQESSLEHFNNLRKANEGVTQSIKDRYEAERRGSVGKVAESGDDSKKKDALRGVDEQIEAQARAAQDIETSLRKQREALDGSARAEREYQDAVVKSRVAMNDNQAATDALIKKRRELNAIPAGAKIHESFAKQTDAEKQALADIQREIQLVKERAAASAAAAGAKLAEMTKGITDEKELAKIKEQAAADAVALGKDTAQQLDQLTARREQVETDSIRRQYAEQKKFNEDQVASTKAAIEARYKLFDEETLRTKQRYARTRELEDLETAHERDLIADARKAFQDDIEARIELENKSAIARAEEQDRLRKKEVTEQITDSRELLDAVKESEAIKSQEIIEANRKTAETLHGLRQKQIAGERDQAIEEIEARKNERLRSAENEKQRLDIIHDAEVKTWQAMDKAERALIQDQTTFNRQQMLQQAKDRQDAANTAIKTEIDKAAKLKALQENVIDKADVKGADVLNGANKKDVLKNLQEKARQKAKTDTFNNNRDLVDKFEFDNDGPDRQKYDQMQKKAQQDAVRKATKDFNSGKTGVGDLAQAQNDVVQKQLGALQQNGKLSADSVQTMTTLLQATADTQSQTQALQDQVAALQKAAGLVAQKAQQGRKQAQAGALQ